MTERKRETGKAASAAGAEGRDTSPLRKLDAKLDELKQKAAAPDATGSEPASKRAAYRAKRESALRELDAKLDELKQKTLAMTAGTRDDLDEAMRALTEKRRRFMRKMAALRDTTGDAWEELKKGADNSWDELEDAFGDFRKGVSAALDRFKGGSKA